MKTVFILVLLFVGKNGELVTSVSPIEYGNMENCSGVLEALVEGENVPREVVGGMCVEQTRHDDRTSYRM